MGFTVLTRFCVQSSLAVSAPGEIVKFHEISEYSFHLGNILSKLSHSNVQIKIRMS